MLSVPLMVGAFVAGVFMFLAPCTLPIVPGYLAFIGGKRVMRNALAFVLGFSLIFIVLGLFAGSFGALVGPYRVWAERLAGALIIFFGLSMLGLAGGFLQREWRISLPQFLQRGAPTSSFLVGALFALGWSPCIGPILATVLLVAASSATMLSGALLLALFALGMGIPFIITAALLERATAAFARSGSITHYAQYMGAVLLLLVGIGLEVGAFGVATTWALEHIPLYNTLLRYM